MAHKQLHHMRFILGILALVFSLAVVSPASATLTLRVSDTISTFTLADGDAGDLAPLTGAVTFLQFFNNVSLNLDTGVSKPILGSPFAPELHLDSLLISTGPVTLTVMLTDTDFSGVLPTSFLGSIGGIIGPAGSTVTYSVYSDLSNAPFGTANLICTTGPLSGNPFAGTCGNNNVPLDDAYSITLLAVVSHAGPGVSSLNASVVDAPEPSSMILLGVGLIGVAAWGRKKINKDS